MFSHIPFHCHDCIYYNHRYYFKGTSVLVAYTELLGLYTSCPNPRHGSCCLESPAENLWVWRPHLSGLQIVLGRLTELVDVTLCLWITAKNFPGDQSWPLKFLSLKFKFEIFVSNPVKGCREMKLSDVYIYVCVYIFLYTYIWEGKLLDISLEDCPFQVYDFCRKVGRNRLVFIQHKWRQEAFPGLEIVI